MAHLNSGAGGQKPICSICYEDLKPVIEDLQSISLCGHVFHELCLQQWLEYCPSEKKPTCPVCKQSCSHKSLTRLYFQSSGDATQLFSDADAEALTEKVKRLEGKLSSMTSNFQSQQLYLKELDEELSKWKGFVKVEEAKNEEFRSENKCLERLVRQKNEELSTKSSECLKLEERNLMLAKELAALKLVTDLNLGEEEMVKLASIGHGPNHANAIDVLKSSLALRNKSYKELMAQCNALGRAQAQTQQKLDKAKEKIKSLRVRLQELERAAEEKENGKLRKLKTLTVLKPERVNVDCVMQNSSSVDNLPLQDQTCVLEKVRNREHNSSNCLDRCNRNIEGIFLQKDSTLLTYKECKNTMDIDDDEHLSKDPDALISFRNKNSSAAHLSYRQSLPKDTQVADAQIYNVDQERISLFHDSGASSCPKISLAGGSSISSSFGQRNELDTRGIALERNMKDVKRSTKDIETVLPDAVQMHKFSAKKDHQAHESAACQRDPIFHGHFGHDLGSRNASKWGRLAEHKASAFASLNTQAQVNKGSLITIGADGRGGKIKVLRAHDQYLGVKEQKLLSKRCKSGANQSGQFQIEHFFEKS